MITNEPKTIKIGGFETDNNPQEITIESGWNLIGNPYYTNLDWSNVQDFNNMKNDISLNNLRLYNGTSYVNGSRLGIFDGAFLFSNTAMTIDVPSYSDASSGRKETVSIVKSSFNNQEDWSIPMKAYVGEYGFELSSIARDSDKKIDPIPPRFPRYTEILFQEYSGSTINYLDFNKRSFFKIKTSEIGSNATLSWENSPLQGKLDANLFLVDLRNAAVIDMMSATAYDYVSNGDDAFFIYNGNDPLDKMINNDQIGEIYPNPNLDNHKILIPFMLSGQKNGSREVNISIFNLSGKLIYSDMKKYDTTGKHLLELNLETFSIGTYLVNIKINNQNGFKRSSQKIIIGK